MYLVGKTYKDNKITGYALITVDRKVIILDETQFNNYKFLNDIRNVNACYSDLLVVKDGVATNNNTAIISFHGNHAMVLSIISDSFCISSMSCDKIDSDNIINKNDFIVFDYENSLDSYKEYAYSKYLEYCSKNSKRSPKPREDFVDEDWTYAFHIMKTFYTADYNDWMRWLG